MQLYSSDGTAGSNKFWSGVFLVPEFTTLVPEIELKFYTIDRANSVKRSWSQSGRQTVKHGSFQVLIRVSLFDNDAFSLKTRNILKNIKKKKKKKTFD